MNFIDTREISKTIFAPIKVGSLPIKNRLCFLPHKTNLAQDCKVSNDMICYYERRAKGGCGLIIVGDASIHPNDMPYERMVCLYLSEVHEGLRVLSESIKKWDAVSILNLNHRGFQSTSAISRMPLWGPSPKADIVFGEICKEMEKGDISELKEAFAGAALSAIRAGFDGVEIDAGPDSLLRQFLSPLTNNRADDYGGSLENRARLTLEIADEIRKEIGDDFLVGLRISVDEQFWGGLTLDEGINAIQIINSKVKIDFIDVVIGTYYNQYLLLGSVNVNKLNTLDTSERVKTSTNIPIIAGYNITEPTEMYKAIVESKTDIIGLVRPLICDPELPLKLKENRLQDISICVRDNFCVSRMQMGVPIACAQNPYVLHKSGPLIGAKVVPSNKRAVVVGGGPGGLKSATVLAEAGFQVTLLERDSELGGQVKLLLKVKPYDEIAGLVKSLVNKAKELNVELALKEEATVKKLVELSPHLLILATGSFPNPRPYPGNYSPPYVVTPFEVLKEEYPLGHRILFVDMHGDRCAMVTAEYLLNLGKEVHIVTSDPFIGFDVSSFGDLYLIRQRLLQKGAKFISDIDIKEINQGVVVGKNIYTNEKVTFLNYDNVIVYDGRIPNDVLYKQLKRQDQKWVLIRIGDCVAPRSIFMAMYEAQQLFLKI